MPINFDKTMVFTPLFIKSFTETLLYYSQTTWLTPCPNKMIYLEDIEVYKTLTYSEMSVDLSSLTNFE